MKRYEEKNEILDNICYPSLYKCQIALLSTVLIDSIIIKKSFYIRSLIFLPDCCTVYLSEDRATLTSYLLKIMIFLL